MTGQFLFRELRKGKDTINCKTWSALKERQRAWIASLLRTEYMRLAQALGRPPEKGEYGIIIDQVHTQIQEREIWIPFAEVSRYFSSKVSRYRKSFE